MQKPILYRTGNTKAERKPEKASEVPKRKEGVLEWIYGLIPSPQI